MGTKDIRRIDITYTTGRPAEHTFTRSSADQVEAFGIVAAVSAGKAGPVTGLTVEFWDGTVRTS